MRTPGSLLPALRRVHLLRETLIACLFVSLVLPSHAVSPNWWTTRGVIIPGKASDDYAAINQGQLKRLTASAVEEMQDKLIGGAGTTLNSLVAGWATGVAEADDYAVVTIGQLKHLAKPVYQRLQAAGVLNTLPAWVTASAPSNEDFAIANIGQAKRLFTFHVPNQISGGLEPPSGWLGSKWTEDPLEIPPVTITSDPFPSSTLKDFFLEEYTTPTGTTLDTTLEMRYAEIRGISGTNHQGNQESLYQLANGRAEGQNNPYNYDFAPGTWWNSLPPGTLYGSTLSHTWTQISAVSTKGILPSDPNYVANRHTEYPYWYGDSNNNVVITGSWREDRWSEVRLRLSNTSNPADRQIIKEYWRSDEWAVSRDKARRYRLVINAGDFESSQEPNFLSSTDGKVFLHEAPPLRGKNISPSDVAGPRYRKIGLNGVPQSDNPPQNQEENDIPADETYVDAYSRTLRHSVTDIWSKVGSTELPLAVRRTSASETWSWNGSLRPAERPDRPFGAGFTSNLTPQISFQYSAGSNGAAPQPIRATVVDEHGSSHSFVQVTLGANNDIWVPDLDQKQDAKTCFDVLTRVPGTTPAVWELRKKFGTTCRYEMMFGNDIRMSNGSFGGKIAQHFPTDRNIGSASYIRHEYGRMRKVTDKQGNELRYTYPDDTIPSLRQSFIPYKIHDPARPSQAIHITQDNGLIRTIRGPSGELVHYFYTTIFDEHRMNHPIPVLNRVVRGDDVEDEDAVAVKYQQVYSAETELDVDPTSPQPTHYGHVDIQAITDERNNTYQFGYADFSEAAQTSYDYSNGYYTFSKRQCGGPRMVKTILRPNGQTVTFGGHRGMHYHMSGNLSLNNPSTGLTTTVTSPTTGTYTYSFTEPHIFCPVPLTEDSPQNVIASFRKMSITSPAGMETYEFDPQAGMALKRATDVSGNVTSYTYDDSIPSPSAALVNYGLLKFDDPTTETNAMHTANFNGIKRYEYEPNFRLLKKVTDEKGTVTEYDIDTLGRRTKETITDAGGKVLRVTEFKYENPAFAGFMTRQIVKTNGLGTIPSGVPLPIGELRTDFAPDSDGRLKQQKVYIDTAATQPLITSYTYTGNGSKRSVTDPRNHTTFFEYEPHTLRLKKATYPNATFKEMSYDAHGNLTEEINEVGAKTFHEYDVLNRRIKSTLDLNGDDEPNPSYTQAEVTSGTAESDPVYDGDIVTLTTYNDFNLPVDETDARSVITHHDYDTAGRRIRTTVNTDGNPASVSADELVTEYVVPIANTPDWVGGSMFDVSGFKPLRVKDPRGFVTEFEYDKLYRTTRTTLHDTSYSPTQDVVTQTEYDQVGNAVKTTDPLSNVTRTDYDGLKRAVKTVLPTKAGGTDSNVPYAEKRMAYTPSGQVWSSTDELGNVTYNVYDPAGRLTATLMPAVEVPGTGGQLLRPQVWQSYDAAGNVMEKSDAVGNITVTEYDQRNRPVKVILPEVLDAETGLSDRPETITEYDNVGQVISVEDPLNRISYSAYDLAGRCFRTIAPPTGSQTHVTLTEHDPAGNSLTVTNAKGQTVTNTYDDLNRLETTTDHEGIINRFGYDKAGNRTSVKDGLEQETLFVYDAQKRLREQEFANGDTWTYFYDALNKTGQKDAKQVVTAYTYDVRNRLRKVTAPDLERRQAYDHAGRLLSVTETGRPEAAVNYTYDALARVTSETSQGVTHTYGYDLTGNRVLAIYGTGRTVATTYDALNRPATIAESGHITTYGYDLAGRALKLIAGNGQVTRNVYDEIGRLTHRTLYASAADLTATGVLAQFGWGHDAIGNVTAHSEEWKANASRPAGTRTTGMTYDGVSRLLTETISDPASGITMTTYTYDAANNRKSKTVAGGSEPGYWHYDYNDANQLVSWTKHDEPEGTLLKSAGLGYDLNGNRTSLEVVGQSGTSSNASLTDQGITYTSVASGSTGDGVSISLKGEQADQPLGVQVGPGNHVIVDLETGPASADTLVDQGITYTTQALHQAGQEVSVRLLADEPSQEEEEVQVSGRDITVKLATTPGAPASGTSQDITYEAVTPGPAGNDLKVHLEKAALGALASVSRAGNDVTVKLKTDSGTPDTLVDQSITYTTTTPHEAGKEVSVTLVADQPNQNPAVQVTGNDIKVLLDTDAGQPTFAENQGIRYEATTPGPAGDDLSVAIQAMAATAPFSVTLPVAPSKQIVVSLPIRPWATASLATLPGVTYQAKKPGLSGNDLTVTHTLAARGQSTFVTRSGNNVTVYLGTDMGKQAQAIFYPEKGGGVTVKAAAPGPAGNYHSIEIKLATAANTPLQAVQSGYVTQVTLASNASNNPTTTVTQLAAKLSSLPSPNPFVVSGASSMVINSSKTLSLTGGGDDYAAVATGSDVAAALAANSTTKDLLQAQATSGNPILQTGTGQLTGGNNPLFSNDVVELLTETPGVSDLVIVSGGKGNSGDVKSVPAAAATVQLSGGGANPKVETTVSQLVTLLNGHQTLLTATGSGTAKIMPLQRRALGGGLEPAVVTKTSEVVSLLSNDTDINNRITVTGGSTTEIAQTGSMQLTGGGLGFTIGSTVTDVVVAINNHSTAGGLITASGSGSTLLSPLPRSVLRGGEPAILSTASDVVALLSGHSVVTATGSGSAILSPLERTYLSNTITKTTYTWNNQDRLTGVTTPDGTRHGYTYDYRARRVQTSRRNGPLPAQTTTLVFSGGLSLAEYESSTSGAITANTPTVHYLRGPDMGGGVGGMLYSIRGSTLKYSLSNGRGDIVAQSDESAAITWTASYEAFGKRPAETGTNLDKQRANSKDEDPTGLLNEGFRYRDLETGTFISRDPAGFVDGPNLYAYVMQNPWTSFDPEGLYSWDEFTGDVGMWASGVGNMWKGYGDVTVGAVVGAGAAVANLPKNVAAVGSNLWEMSQLDLGTFTEAHAGASQEIAENAVQAASDFGERLAEGDERTWGQAVGTVLTAGGAKGMQFAKAAPAAELTAGATGIVAKVEQAVVAALPNLNTVNKGAKGVHKNSLGYVGETHVYRVKGSDGSTYKIGESAQGVRAKDGKSVRAEQQARRLTRETGEQFETDIRKTFPDKASARDYETRLIERFRRMYGEETLPGNKTNR